MFRNLCTDPPGDERCTAERVRARPQTRTDSITRMSTFLTRKAVTEELKGSFRRELSSLGFRRVEVELEEAGGAEGVLYHRLVLARAPGVELPKVVSEGEQRCLAIASFFRRPGSGRFRCSGREWSRRIAGEFTMYIFTPEQHCPLSLSANIWRLRGEAKRHGLRFNEESATEVFLLDLASQFPGNVKIVPFNRREEGRIGADWAWAFVGPDGQWCQGMLVQAKRLDDDDREYPELFYRPPAKGSQPPIAQLDRLIDNGRRLGLPPVFALYNHLSAPGRVPRGKCGSLRLISQSLPESRGIAVASAFEVRNSKPDKRYDCHREHSLPLHCLLCS